MTKSLLLVACVALVGCTGSGSSGSGGGTFTEFCTNYADAVASQISTCSGGPKDLWAKALGEAVQCQELGNSVDAGRSVYDAASAQACITSTAGLSCTSILNSPSTADCVKTLNGRVATGGTCYGSIDCGDGSTCVIPKGSCSGTCKVQIAAGAACGIADDCVSGYYCANSVCTLNPPPGMADVGTSCSGGINCKTGLVCDRVTKNCAKAVKEGQACTFGHGLCENFTSCSAAGTCVRGSMAGGACGTTQAADGGSEYESSSCIDSWCKTTGVTLTGTCAAPLALEATCTSSFQCQSRVCTASKCTARCAIP